MKAEKKTQYYREVSFEKRKPKWKHNSYFYIVHSGGHTYGEYSGQTGHMERHLKDGSDHTITWLEPECDYNPKAYYKRISRTKLTAITMDSAIKKLNKIKNN